MIEFLVGLGVVDLQSKFRKVRDLSLESVLQPVEVPNRPEIDCRVQLDNSFSLCQPVLVYCSLYRPENS